MDYCGSEKKICSILMFCLAKESKGVEQIRLDSKCGSTYSLIIIFLARLKFLLFH